MELLVKAVEAEAIPKLDVTDNSDPFLKIRISTSAQKWKTKTIHNTAEPVWNEEFRIPVTSSLGDILKISLYDDDHISKDDMISCREFKVRDFPIGKVIDSWYTFSPVDGVESGGNIRLVFYLDKIGNIPDTL